MTRFWTRAEVKELVEIVERLQRDSGTVARLSSMPVRHEMVRALGLSASHQITQARLSLEDALRVSEEK